MGWVGWGLVRWFVGSLVRWFIGSLVRWFVGSGSLVRWFVGSLVGWFVGSLVRSLVGWLVGRPAATLEQLRGDAASNGREWLGSALQDVNRKDVREFAQAAGLRVRKAGSDTWLSVGELRAALLEHLAPQRSVAPDEFDVFFFFVLCFGFLLIPEKSGHIEGVLRVGVRHGGFGHQASPCRW